MKKHIIEIIERLINFQQQINCDCGQKTFNQKKITLNQGIAENNLRKIIQEFRIYLLENEVKIRNLVNELQNLIVPATIIYRIKNENSIEDKINRYIERKPEHGEIPVNKCLNDLLGFRIIEKNCLTLEEIKEIINDFSNDTLKVIIADNHEYKAVHLYIKENNYHFQWELQFWDAINESANVKSHKEYKQGYTDWERNNNEEEVKGND